MSTRTKVAVVLLILVNLLLVGMLAGFLSVFLSASIILNVGLFWFIKNQYRLQAEMIDNLSDIHEKLEVFRKHLESVHELEEYYGDQEIQRLILHSRTLNNELVDYQERFGFAQVTEGEEEFAESETDESAEKTKEKNGL